MTPEEYYRELKVEGAKEWKQLLATVDSGTHPSAPDLAYLVMHYGLTPDSPEAVYVANRMTTPIPKGKHTRNRGEISDEWLRYVYKIELDALRILWKSDRTRYDATHKGKTPAIAAREIVGPKYKVGTERIRKLPKKMGGR